MPSHSWSSNIMWKCSLFIFSVSPHVRSQVSPRGSRLDDMEPPKPRRQSSKGSKLFRLASKSRITSRGSRSVTRNCNISPPPRKELSNVLAEDKLSSPGMDTESADHTRARNLLLSELRQKLPDVYSEATAARASSQPRQKQPTLRRMRSKSLIF